MVRKTKYSQVNDAAENSEGASVAEPAPGRAPFLLIGQLSAAFVATAFCDAALWALLTPYALELGLRRGYASNIWLAPTLIGLLLSPAAGVFSDRCSSKFGRRRPFILFGAILAPIGHLLIASASDLGKPSNIGEDSGRNGALMYLLFGLSVIGFSHAILNVVVRALISDVVPNYQVGVAFSMATFCSPAGLMLGYATAEASWGQAGYFQGLITKGCTSKDLCLDLRVCMCFAAALSILCNLLVLISSPDPPLPHPSGSSKCCQYQAIASEANEVQSILQIPDMRAVVASSVLAWAGWWSFQVFVTHFVATELFGGTEQVGSPRHSHYKEGLHFASGALLVCAGLGWPLTLLLPKLLEWVGGFSLWLASDLLFASFLLAGFIIREYPHRSMTFVWLSSFGVFYVVQNTVPFTLITRLARARGASRGASIALVSISSHSAQLGVAMAEGYINETVSSDMGSFAVGALCSIWAGVICSFLLVRDQEFQKATRQMRTIAPSAGDAL